MGVILVLLFMLLAFLDASHLVTPDIYPRVQLSFCLLYFILMLLVLVLVSWLTARGLRRKGEGLIALVRQIQNQEFGEAPEGTGIQEIDAVLMAMEEMQDSLKAALTAQWELEQNRERQIAALLHDLKTPLTILKSNLYLMDFETLTPEGRQSLGDMGVAAEDMAYYTQRLLEATQNQAKPVEMDWCSLGDILDALLQEMAVLFKEKQLTIQREMAVTDSRFWGNAEEIKRAAQNIIANAIDFTPVASSLYFQMDGEEVWLRLEIVDSGQGFSAAALSKGTDAFFMDSTARSGKRHYGLGLAIAKGIITAHGGDMTLDNHPDGGARITLCLPREVSKK